MGVAVQLVETFLDICETLSAALVRLARSVARREALRAFRGSLLALRQGQRKGGFACDALCRKDAALGSE